MKVIAIIFIVVSVTFAEPPVPSNNYLPSVSTDYGTPTVRSFQNDFKRISPQYDQPIQHSNIPSTNYGVPFAEYSSHYKSYNSPSTQYSEPSLEYGTPGYSSLEDDISEPANYNFQYDVQDSQYGNDFGHVEKRQGDNAQGKYSVLLPDGRRQTVEYTADARGYKPRISYDRTNNGGYRRYNGRYNNYNNGANSGSNGYRY